MTDRILLVDDEPNILRGYKRHLRKQFEFDLAEGGREALEMLNEKGPYAVVISDMQMPDVDGVKLLSSVSELSPDTVRMMLTGNADQKTAVDAVNEGHIFRFLSKPCPPETLAKAIQAGLEQYRLIRAEQDVLTKTLGGSVTLMTEVLSMVNPKAFGRASRIRPLARQICQRLGVENAWEVEIAAMLSQIGCVSVPEETLNKLFDDAPLTDDERELLSSHPKIGGELVGKIPRLEGVAKIISYQDVRFDGSCPGQEDVPCEQIPLGARILKVVLDYDALATATSPPEAVHTITCERSGWYDPSISDLLSDLIDANCVTKSVNVEQLTEGMIFDEHVESLAGEILIAKGQEVNESLLNRLRDFTKGDRGVRQPISVRCFFDQSREKAVTT